MDRPGRLAVFEDGDPVGEAEDFVHPVGDVEDGGAPRLELADRLEEHLRLLVGEGGGGLVEDEQPALGHHGADDLQQGALGRGERGGREAEVDLDLQLPHDRLHPRLHFCPVDGKARFFLIVHPQVDVLHPAEGGDEVAVLVDDVDADVPALPPPPKGERPNGSLSQWSVTSFGFGRNFAGFGKRLCAYSKKSLWCGARRDGWSRPLPLGAPRPMIFK